MRIALVNTNQIKPPISPIGLDYTAEALDAAGHRVDVLDLCWSDDWQTAVHDFFSRNDYPLIGLTLRNIDDCFLHSRHSFLPLFNSMVRAIRQETNGTIALGGVGFSSCPEEILNRCDADIGVWGDGEFTLPELANRIDSGRPWDDLPNLIIKENGSIRRNPNQTHPLDCLPTMTRRWFDNPRYFREGGQLGIETKRGCPNQCVYCIEPAAKGHTVRVRPPKAVTDELEALLDQGIDCVHTCDSEFNIPERHAREICQEIINRNLGNRIRWYAYCSPMPFSIELARLMRGAGCAGINFGVDHGDPVMLKSLGRDYSPDDILKAAEYCHDCSLVVMFDLLLGGPGETSESIRRTIECMKRSQADQIGVQLGLRVYPGTGVYPIVTAPSRAGGLIGGTDFNDPLFFIEPAIKESAAPSIEQLIGGDKRFFFFNPMGDTLDYNYNANQGLIDAIRQGARGAYWDILRRIDKLNR